MQLKKKKKIEFEKLWLCLVKNFVFCFQKLVFGNIKKKQFLYFQNQKHVWLVEMKKSYARGER